MVFNLKFFSAKNTPRVILKRIIQTNTYFLLRLQRIFSLCRKESLPPPPPLPIAPSLHILGLSHMLITDFKCIRLSLYVKMKIKQNLTNVISTKIAVQFFFLMECYWLSSLNEESFLPDKFREMTKHSNSALRTPA